MYCSFYRIVLFISVSLGVTNMFGQNDADLFRYSKHYHGGSARFESMSGAFGSLGGDISSVQINPAGLGRYSSSQVSLSLNTSINSTQSDFMSNKMNDLKTKFSIPSFGVILTRDISAKNKGNLYSQFGFGLNRLMSYSQETTIQGEQYPSLLDGFISQAKGYAPTELAYYFPFSTSLAYESYAIDYDQVNGQYLSFLNSGNMKMKRVIQNSGAINEAFLSYSINRLNKLYFGGSINFRFINFEEKYIHSEDLVVADPDFNGFDYSYAIKTNGTGINLRLGAIYLVTDGFRIGASFQTPTWIGMMDKWTADMTSRFKVGDYKIPADLVPSGQYKYKMVTPLKTTISASYVIGMRGLISADIDYTNYNMARLKSTTDITYDKYDFEAENKEAKTRLAHAMNVRIGGEFNIQQKFFVRAGFAYYGNAYKKSENVDAKPDLSFSGGLGYKQGRFSIDLAYVNRTTKRNYYPFYDSNIAAIRLSSNQVIISGSIRF